MVRKVRRVRKVRSVLPRRRPKPPSLLSRLRARGTGRSAQARSATRVHIGSDILVAEDELVTDPVVAIGGSVTVLGKVNDDVVAVGGSVHLGPKAGARRCHQRGRPDRSEPGGDDQRRHSRGSHGPPHVHFNPAGSSAARGVEPVHRLVQTVRHRCASGWSCCRDAGGARRRAAIERIGPRAAGAVAERPRAAGPVAVRARPRVDGRHPGRLADRHPAARAGAVRRDRVPAGRADRVHGRGAAAGPLGRRADR